MERGLGSRMRGSGYTCGLACTFRHSRRVRKVHTSPRPAHVPAGPTSKGAHQPAGGIFGRKGKNTQVIESDNPSVIWGLRQSRDTLLDSP